MQSIILERALNFLLETHQIDTQSLDGKTIHFALQEVQSLTIDVDFICANGRIFVTTDIGDNADVDVKLAPTVFLKLFQGEDLIELLRKDEIIINGDVKTAQLLVDLLQQVEIDLEELLSNYTGDIIAHQIGKAVKRLKSSNNPIEAVKDKIVHLLTQPAVNK
ncbi:Protein YigP (COG3165) clustered with ubiquinone biosynthetic genes [uncultured Candidatus Thioglobus sp.]|nr:Protein YigP (COG3165) clustered with ubiquinone biosynthetic genes [uncultured Candidatus Thioglobus sp.]